MGVFVRPFVSLTSSVETVLALDGLFTNFWREETRKFKLLLLFDDVGGIGVSLVFVELLINLERKSSGFVLEPVLGVNVPLRAAIMLGSSRSGVDGEVGTGRRPLGGVEVVESDDS